jgi:hypothetical protein
MRIRHLSLAIALLLPFGLVAATDAAPPSAAYIATTAVEDPQIEAAMVDAMRLQRDVVQRTAYAEKLAAEKEAAEAAELEATAARAAEVLAQQQAAKAAANRAKVTVTTVARRYTATTVASSPATEPRTGSLPPKYVSDCESGGNPRAVNPNGHYGKWQFSQSTWESVGGTGRPDHATEAEQDYRASILWDNGNGAGHWECY